MGSVSILARYSDNARHFLAFCFLLARVCRNNAASKVESLTFLINNVKEEYYEC